jgi:N-acetylglucosamine-6-phosphate deacetylase
MKIDGVNVFNGAAVEIRVSNVIEGVDDLIAPPPGLPFVAPGFIDLQVNGFAGIDYCAPDSPHEGIARSIRAQFATGVTRIYPTIITGTEANIIGALRNLAEAKRTIAEGAAMEGYHVEGPHISPEDGPRGAHPQHCVRPPDVDEYRRWQDAAEGEVRLVTVSPEWPETPRYIERLVRDGVVVSIGHTKADAQQIADAVSAGATMSTHLGNGAHSVLARHPNYIWEQMADDRLAASFIVDGIHLGASFLKVAVRAKGVERSVLVTDAVMPAGCEPGPFKLGEVDVELHGDGSVRLRGGTRLAGSALTMDRAVGNMVRMAGVSLREAVAMATTNAARVGRIAGRQRGLSPGERADLVVFEMVDGAVQVRETYVSGERVH